MLTILWEECLTSIKYDASDILEYQSSTVWCKYLRIAFDYNIIIMHGCTVMQYFTLYNYISKKFNMFGQI